MITHRFFALTLLITLGLLTACSGSDAPPPAAVPTLLPPLEGAITPENVESLSILADLPGGNLPLNALAFNATGSRLAGGDIGGGVRVWDMASGALLESWRADGGAVISVAFNADGVTLSAGYQNGALWLWSLETGENVAVLAELAEPALPDALSPDGALRAVPQAGGEVALAESQNGSVRSVIVADPDAEPGAIPAVTFSPAGDVLATSRSDGGVTLWGVAVGVAITVPFTEAEVNNVLADVIAQNSDIERATIQLSVAQGARATFRANVLGQRLDGDARVNIGHDGRRINVTLSEVRLGVLPAPDAVVDEVNRGLAELAEPRLAAELDARVGVPYTIQRLTVGEGVLLVVVRVEQGDGPAPASDQGPL